jgi:CDP-glucose 4,6-dehydratase
VITRCGNFFGGGDLNWNRIVPGTIRSLLRGERPVIRSDGTCLRDYFYIEDGVEAYLLAARRLAENPELRGEAFNFAYGKPLSVIALVKKITDSMGSSLQPVITNAATHEIKDQYLDATKAHRVLGWTPVWSLENALKKTMDWYRDFLQRSPSVSHDGR